MKRILFLFLALITAVSTAAVPYHRPMKPLPKRTSPVRVIPWKTMVLRRFLTRKKGNKEDQDAMQMVLGRCLYPSLSKQAIVFYGLSGTGKSTVSNLIKALVGDNCYCSIPLAEMSDMHNRPLLVDQRVNITNDISLGASPEHTEAFFQSVVDGENILVDRQDGLGIHMEKATTLCILEANEPPRFSLKSNASWDRLLVFSFKKRFRDTLIDNPDLLEDLLSEMPGILNWSLRGLFKLFNQPLKRIPQTKESLMALTELKQQA